MKQLRRTLISKEDKIYDYIKRNRKKEFNQLAEEIFVKFEHSLTRNDLHNMREDIRRGRSPPSQRGIPIDEALADEAIDEIL